MDSNEGNDIEHDFALLFAAKFSALSPFQTSRIDARGLSMWRPSEPHRLYNDIPEAHGGTIYIHL